jgi:hypothetical protein
MTVPPLPCPIARQLILLQTIQDRARGGHGVALRLNVNVRLRSIAKISAVEDEIHGALSLKLAA